MVTALYRRYRPETFAELIGQAQVTDPLRTALRNDRVNHAYLFSGPRGCGKTTSARILARCLNCAEGPTDTPCGVCPSCVELSRDGSGSLDVVEIDAASHNGVDDARDLRERAVFAPARDRYKIFILDEAHMVTPQGFNALLKIVEEPPEHVKFIFATTEPDKVIGTIRSRTHHYPFRLVPPAQMLEYVHELVESEKVAAEPGVLPLVVRAGGGSVRDTLSLLDQLIAGSDGTTVRYERAVALLGFTHGALLGDVVDALGARNAASAFGAVDRVIQTGQDPRRFVEDLLERLRDLIVVSAVGGSTDSAAAVLRGFQPDEIDRMAQQANAFGAAELSRAADVVNAALTEMTGATSPRLHLELMIARVLIPASDDTERGALARLERLERRIGVDTSADVAAPTAAAPAASPAARAPAPASAATAVPALVPVVARVAQPTAEPTAEPTAKPAAGVAAPAAASMVAAATPSAAAPVSFEQLRDAWAEILDAVEKARRTAWMVVFNSRVVDLKGDVLYLSFVSENDVASFKQQQGAGEGVSEVLRRAIVEVLGLRVKFIVRVDASAPPLVTSAVAPAPAPAPANGVTAATPATAAAPTTTWATVAVPSSDPTRSETEPATRAAASVAPPAPLAPAAETPPLAPAAETPAPANAAPAPAPAVQARTAPSAASAPQARTAPPAPQSGSDGPTEYEPVEEADREPEPEFEPDDSPIVGTTRPDAPRGAQAPQAAPAPPTTPQATRPPARAATGVTFDKQRYGESVVREILGASFIEELAVVPRVIPRGE
ncbi:MAG: DNA polymerase III subunit gamma and tau [Burkholderiaceae bacterium]|nr:DNA polymerase III subunit gamma and tau [Microbacteriaceae bacterium]